MTEGINEVPNVEAAPEAPNVEMPVTTAPEQEVEKTKIVTAKDIKLAISEVLLYRDRYMNTEGKRNMRDNIEPSAFRTWVEIVNAFRPTMEIGFYKPEANKKTRKIDDVAWYAASDKNMPKGLDVYGERHTDKEVVFTEQQVRFIEACYADRKDLQGFKEYKLLGGWLYDTVEEAGQ